MCEITWNKNIESEHKAEIEKYLASFLWLVPQWVQNIHVNLWDSGAGVEGETISIKVNYDYRSVCLDFICSWLNQSEELKQEQVIRELIHIPLSIIADYARDSFNLLCPDSEAEKFNRHLIAELTIRHESATQDLAHVIYNKFKNV